MVLLTRLAKQVYRRSTEELLGMHLRLLMALSYVRDHDGAPQQELAEALCMDANNVVLLLNELEELGYVARRRDPEDRRRHRVELTPPGRRARHSPSGARKGIEDDVLRGLEPGRARDPARAAGARAAPGRAGRRGRPGRRHQVARSSWGPRGAVSPADQRLGRASSFALVLAAARSPCRCES